MPEPADFWGWVEKGNYDHEWKILAEHLKPEHTFIDIGAWVGSHSLFASTIAKQVLAVEPDPIAYAILEKNLDHVDNAAICNIAVGNAGTIQMGSGCLGASTTRRNPNSGGGIGAWEHGHTFEVLCVPLQELLREVSDPLFIKMDVEGMEEEILRDWPFFEFRKPSLLIELHPWWWNDEAETRKDLERVKTSYKTVRQIQQGLYFLEN